MLKQFSDFNEWLSKNEGRVIRYLKYKRMFTPYEEKMAFSDESQYEEGGYYEMGIIEEAVNLGSDWLLGLRVIDDDGRICRMLRYLRLSEICLTYFDADDEIELYTVEEDDEL